MVEYAFDHLHYRCTDIEVTAKFLIDMLGGVELSRRAEPNPMIAVRVGGQNMFLSPKGPNDQIEGDMSARRYGLEHWGLKVKDLDAAYEELKAKGVEFVQPPRPFGAIRIAFLLSPDNVQIELCERK